MKSRVVFALCSIGCWFLSSCGRIECPGFPEHLVDYFPYKTGNILSFVNQENDTLTFWIREFAISKEHTLPYSLKATCSDLFECSFIALRLISESLADEVGIIHQDGGQVISSEIIHAGISVYSENRDNKNSIWFSISDSYWDFDYIDTAGIIDLISTEESGKNPFDIQNGALFGETVILEDAYKLISRVVITKGKGITEFFDQKHNFQWKSIKKQ